MIFLITVAHRKSERAERQRKTEDTENREGEAMEEGV